MNHPSRSGFTVLVVLVLTLLWAMFLTLAATQAFDAHRWNRALLEATRERAAGLQVSPGG